MVLEVDRDAPLYEGILPIHIISAAAVGSSERVVPATVRLLSGSTVCGVVLFVEGDLSKEEACAVAELACRTPLTLPPTRLQPSPLGGRARIVYLEIVDEAAVMTSASPPAGFDADVTRATSLTAASLPSPHASSAGAAAASDGLLHHSVILAESEFDALAGDQALTVAWSALPHMLVQLLEAARCGGDSATGSSPGSATPRGGDEASSLISASLGQSPR